MIVTDRDPRWRTGFKAPKACLDTTATWETEDSKAPTVRKECAESQVRMDALDPLEIAVKEAASVHKVSLEKADLDHKVSRAP